MTAALEPYEGKPCPVCGLPDPDHDWDVHDAQAAPHPGRRGAERLTGGLPNMLARSSTRGGHRVRVLALHTTEGILRARDLRAWAGWTGSSHASGDADGELLGPADGFVPYHLAAWTLRSGNPWSENIELCGFARWTRADWLARPRLLDAAARWLADRALANLLPLVKITAAQYRAGASGVIDHYDHTVGYRDGTHTDVGTGFPWDVVLPHAQALIDALNTPPAPAIPALIPMEDTMQIKTDDGANLPVPPPPPGYKAMLLVAGDSVHGTRVYSKGMDTEVVVGPVLTDKDEWVLWIPPGKRMSEDVSRYQTVHVGNLGPGVAGVSIVLLPAA